MGGTYVHMYLRDYCQSLHFPCGNVCMMLCAVFCTSSVVTMATNCQKAEFRKKLNMYHLAPRIMTCLMDAPRTAVSGNVGTCLTHTHMHTQTDRQTDTHTHTHTHTLTQPPSYSLPQLLRLSTSLLMFMLTRDLGPLYFDKRCFSEESA